MTKQFIHPPAADNIGLFRKSTTETSVVYTAVPFSPEALQDNYLLIRTIEDPALEYCRYFPVQKLLEDGAHVPYYAVDALQRIRNAITPPVQPKQSWLYGMYAKVATIFS